MKKTKAIAQKQPHECAKCGWDGTLWKYDGALYCEKCLYDVLGIEMNVTYSCDYDGSGTKYFDYLEDAFEDCGAKKWP